MLTISTYVDFLVQVRSQSRAELLGGVDDHQKDGETGVVLVFHHVDFLRAQVGQKTSAEDVWTSDTCFGVEVLEPKRKHIDQMMQLKFLDVTRSPFVWNEAHANFARMFRSHWSLEAWKCRRTSDGGQSSWSLS